MAEDGLPARDEDTADDVFPAATDDVPRADDDDAAPAAADDAADAPESFKVFFPAEGRFFGELGSGDNGTLKV